jgi:hypothetical protein
MTVARTAKAISNQVAAETQKTAKTTAEAIPNQLKSLLSTCSTGDNKAVVNAFVSPNKSDSENYISWLLNYGLIYRIEFLTGFGSNSMTPSWQTLTKTILDSFAGNVLCRIVLFQDRSLGVGYFDFTEPEIYNKYFILSGTPILATVNLEGIS